ncbi:hypothetical protein P3L10_027965 [Capsicum annuum]
MVVWNWVVQKLFCGLWSFFNGSCVVGTLIWNAKQSALWSTQSHQAVFIEIDSSPDANHSS